MSSWRATVAAGFSPRPRCGTAEAVGRRRLHVHSLLAAPAILALLLLAGCGADGAPKYSGPPPDPVALYGECAFCHRGTADRLANNGGHGSTDIKCEFCHIEPTPAAGAMAAADFPVTPPGPGDPGYVGPGHRLVPVCADCHSDVQTHFDPNADNPRECTVCHTPHGSPNLLLVRQSITTPSDARAPILFNNLSGKADGSFASVSHPGTGVCEVCHTTTRFYRSDGTGEPHFTFTCFTCHSHANAFAPE